MGRRKITDEANCSTDTAEDNEDEEREQLTQRMPASLVNQVDEVADELGMSRNASVNMLVKKGLQNILI
jgi:Ran GTPase-activating protein (RanGAP) involved in mRNA processing and transport